MTVRPTECRFMELASSLGIAQESIDPRLRHARRLGRFARNQPRYYQVARVEPYSSLEHTWEDLVMHDRYPGDEVDLLQYVLDSNGHLGRFPLILIGIGVWLDTNAEGPLVACLKKTGTNFRLWLEPWKQLDLGMSRLVVLPIQCS
jgi:hypothetical protein